MRLMTIKEEVEDPQIAQRIHSILIPREFTKLDEIANILFSTTEDIKQDSLPLEEDGTEQQNTEKNQNFKPVAFHEGCILRIQDALGAKLIKRSRAQYSTPDKSLVVNCAVSKEHNPDQNPNYWFGFHPHQRDALKIAGNAYAAFGCGSSETVLLIPYSELESLLDGMWTTQNEDRMYWHVVIYKKEQIYNLHLKKGQKNIDVTRYLLT
jgi:hypothetical protein